MTAAGIGRLGRLLRQFRNMSAPPALILLYHRVADVDSDPWSLCVTPQHFAKHLEIVRKYGYPARLNQLNQALRDGKSSARSIAITFDDGYANNLYNAKPLLERYNIPATVFVTSGYIGKNREFWWDELDQILLQPGKLPESLSLNINGSVKKWMLGAAVDYSEADYRRDYRRYAPNAERGSRLLFYYSVWQKLQPLPDERRREALDEIMAWAKVKPAARPTHRPLASEEVGRLEEGGLLEVGGHTVTHPFLTAHPLSLQRDEIRQSRADLEEVRGHSLACFSYPYGNYTAETATLVREDGFCCACSTFSGNVRRNTNLFELPRFEVGNWDGEKFAKRISNWFKL